MNRRHNPILAVTFFFLAAWPVFGEVIDRIVVVVNDTFIITLSDIRKERAIQSALGSDPGSEEATANWLVDKYLVEDQINQFRTFDILESDVDEQLKGIQAPSGISEKDFREAIRSKLRRAEFIKQRFGEFARTTDEELANYYVKTLVPEFQRRGEPVPPLEKVSELVRANVIIERMYNEFNEWREELLRRATIDKILQ